MSTRSVNHSRFHLPPARVAFTNSVELESHLVELEYVAMNTFAGGTRGAYDRFELDYFSVAATEALRTKHRASRTGTPPMIDRGEGYEKMIRGEFRPWVRTA